MFSFDFGMPVLKGIDFARGMEFSLLTPGERKARLRVLVDKEVQYTSLRGPRPTRDETLDRHALQCMVTIERMTEQGRL